MANHRTYDSFGNLESETDSSVDVAFGYTGKWVDPETGYTHHLNRWYDPNIGKWLSEDPIGFNGGDTNISRYVANEVISKTDSNGLEFGFGTVGTLGTGDGEEEEFSQQGGNNNQDDDEFDDLAKQDQQGNEAKPPLTDEEFEKVAEDIMANSKIPNITYVEDPIDGSRSGNDCDDFATRAFAVFTREFEEKGMDVKVELRAIGWATSRKVPDILNPTKPATDGHVVMQLTYNAKVYINEPQTGDVFPNPRNPKDILLNADFENSVPIYPDVHPTWETDVIRDKLYANPGEYYDDTKEPRHMTSPPELRHSAMKEIKASGGTQSPGGNDIDAAIKKLENEINKK